MSKILLAEVNVSEGTNPQKIEKMTAALKGTAEIIVIDQNSDKDHNRTVYTYIGTPEAVLQATKKLTDAAIELINMAEQKGSHPRMGAVDVVPFVPVRNVSNEEALAIARAYGEYLGAKGVPVFYY